MNRAIFFVLVLGLTCASGCGKSRPPLATVAGNVTFRGKPLANATIVFDSGHRLASGKIVNGEIAGVTTFQQNDGAPIGSHRVAIQASESRDDSAVAAHPGEAHAAEGYMGVGKSLIPTRYRDPRTSGLTCVLQPGTNIVHFELTD